VGSVSAFEAIGLEKVAPTLGEHGSPLIGAERSGMDQALTFEMPHTSSGISCVVSVSCEIALGHHAKRTDGPEDATLGTVDFVDAITVPHWAPLPAVRQVDILREDDNRLATLLVWTRARATSTDVPLLTSVPAIVTRVVSIPHGYLPGDLAGADVTRTYPDRNHGRHQV
jgi:hypothetical protein